MYVLHICVPKRSERIFKQHGNKRQRLVNSEFLLSTRPKQTRPPPPSRSLVGAVGTHPISLIIPIMLWADIPIKGEQPPSTKH